MDRRRCRREGGGRTNTALTDSPQLIDTAVSSGRNATGGGGSGGGIDRIALTHGKQTKTNFTIMTMARSHSLAPSHGDGAAAANCYLNFDVSRIVLLGSDHFTALLRSIQ